MRSESEMLDLILHTAREDERIRAVVLSGSRADPDVPRDPFQDFDVVYVVTDVAHYRDDPTWIDRFGERMILQRPDDMKLEGEPPRTDGGYAWLMQYADGNRIDLTLAPADRLSEFAWDQPGVVLLDKDGLLDPLPPAGAPVDRRGRSGAPTAKQFADCCNEFWWVCPYVAKGLWRREVPYARHMADCYVRPQLVRMLGWHVGVETGFRRGAGKAGRFLERRLEPPLWSAYLRTYADADYGRSWDALMAMCELFRTVATLVAADLGYEYPSEDDARVSAHLRRVRDLPGDATEIN